MTKLPMRIEFETIILPVIIALVVLCIGLVVYQYWWMNANNCERTGEQRLQNSVTSVPLPSGGVVTTPTVIVQNEYLCDGDVKVWQ